MARSPNNSNRNSWT